ncbi:copper chaperone PCu(A)C [Microbacterium sp. NPDC089189]|uniref:copper chaperone PCu(A)C n=1 Tax=Microbacterium sp. NPDC089189 TaxID=3154972 RepID=UPI0034362CAF
MNTLSFRTRAGIVGLALAALALTGCAGAPAPAVTDAAPAADAISVTDAWVTSADSGMSAGFGSIENDGDTDVTVTAALSEASSMLELHETVENESGAMVMRQIEGGFVIPAHGSLDLAPGGDHIMLMDLAAPLVAGDEVTFTLVFADDSRFTFTAPVKDYAGANENYEGGDADMDMEH